MIGRVNLTFHILNVNNFILQKYTLVLYATITKNIEIYLKRNVLQLKLELMYMFYWVY